MAQWLNCGAMLNSDGDYSKKAAGGTELLTASARPPGEEVGDDGRASEPMWSHRPKHVLDECA